jgi:hypothetical protein
LNKTGLVVVHSKEKKKGRDLVVDENEQGLASLPYQHEESVPHAQLIHLELEVWRHRRRKTRLFPGCGYGEEEDDRHEILL